MKDAAFSCKVAGIIACLILSTTPSILFWIVPRCSMDAPTRGALLSAQSVPDSTSTTGQVYLVQATNAYGRYSNMRRALLNALSLASYLNRTLVYAPFGNCLNDEGVEDLFDFSSHSAQPMTVNLKPVCKPHPGRSSMIVRKKCQDPYICMREADSPRASQYQPEVLYTAGFLWRPRHAQADLWTLDEIRQISRSEPTRCIAMQETFYVTSDLAIADRIKLNEMHNHMQAMLLPTKRIQDAAAAYLHERGLDARRFAAIHLRLTDIGGKTNTRGLDCTADVFEFIAKIKSHGDMPVLLATDNPASNCTQVVASALRTTLVESGIWSPDSCMEAAFVQEVMGRSYAFVGVRNSTFSAAIEGIRMTRYKQELNGNLYSV
jgi:hypothetical protein